MLTQEELGRQLQGEANGMGTDLGFSVGIFLKNYVDFILQKKWVGRLAQMSRDTPQIPASFGSQHLPWDSHMVSSEGVFSVPQLPSAFLPFVL